jgi:hypothetical protein
VRAALEVAAALSEGVAQGYTDGGDAAIGCGLYLTASNIRAIAADPDQVAAIVAKAKGAGK